MPFVHFVANDINNITYTLPAQLVTCFPKFPRAEAELEEGRFELGNHSCVMARQQLVRRHCERKAVTRRRLALKDSGFQG